MEPQKHLDRTVRSWLGVSDPLVPIPKLPDSLARLLLRAEEFENPCRDQWGQWEHPFSENYRQGSLWIPEIDRWLTQQRQYLQDVGVHLVPLWPQNHKFSLCLTHDVDVLGARAGVLEKERKAKLINPSQKWSFRQAKKQFKRWLKGPNSGCVSTVPSLERCAHIESELGVHSSYFFIVYPSTHPSEHDCTYRFDDLCQFEGNTISVSRLMQLLAERGHDVGLHGSYYSAVEPPLLAQQKCAIEIALGQPVTTTRQHWLNWDCRKTPLIQQQAGIQVDSTLGFNRNVGYRCGTSLPHFWFDYEKKQRLALLQVPLIIQEAALTSSSALEYNAEMALDLLKQFIDETAANQSCLTLLWHPDKFATPLFCDLYREAIVYALSKGAWVTSLGNINQWWRTREQQFSEAVITDETLACASK